MRVLFCLACLIPAPMLAETVLATSTVSAVTVYPEGAQVTREVTFSAPAGQHELLIADLPAATVPEMIRLTGQDGLALGAFSLRTDRLPPRDEVLSPDLQAAKDAIEALEADERSAMAAVAAINARIEAAEAQAGFLRGVKAEGDAVTVEALQGIARMIGVEVLAARQMALAAIADLPAADKALANVREDLDHARAAYDALPKGDADHAALSVAIGMPSQGQATLTVTHFIEAASWEPVYDLMLSRKDGVKLTVGRGVLVSQDSGEDWAGIMLTLSTAQPSAQAAPSALWPELRRIVDEDVMEKGAADAMAAPESMVAEAMVVGSAQAAIEGDVVVYRYPSAVDVAAGVEDLRLALDQIDLTPKIEARAVPRYDRTAFVLATFTNESKEILLPGQAYLMREGTLVGSTYLNSLAPGAEAEIAFGLIDGLRLTRDMPLRAEGDRGFITTSSQIEEQAILKIENLTDEAWPVRLMDQVPYSEQEDLEISHTADPAPTETDVDGQRGVLAWEFDLAPGASQEVTLNHLISWPEGMTLQ